MSYSIGAMLRTQCQGHSDPKIVHYNQQHLGAPTHEI